MAKRSKYLPNKTTQNTYEVQLRKIARHAAALVNAHIDPEDPSVILDPVGLQRSAALYSEALTPWATVTATKMFTSLDKQNANAYRAYSEKIGVAYKVELHDVHGNVARDIIGEQVGLIKSIPLDAATRAQDYAYQAAQGGMRADYVAQQIQATTDVTESRATLIARTEIARSNSAINQSRSKSLGITHYIWRTAGDDRVRQSHAELDGTVQSFDNPPTVGDEGQFNAGEVFNCRCYCEPQINVSELF